MSIKGNQLETVPIWISRNGLQLAYKKYLVIYNIRMYHLLIQMP